MACAVAASATASAAIVVTGRRHRPGAGAASTANPATGPTTARPASAPTECVLAEFVGRRACPTASVIRGPARSMVRASMGPALRGRLARCAPRPRTVEARIAPPRERARRAAPLARSAWVTTRAAAAPATARRWRASPDFYVRARRIVRWGSVRARIAVSPSARAGCVVTTGAEAAADHPARTARAAVAMASVTRRASGHARASHAVMTSADACARGVRAARPATRRTTAARRVLETGAAAAVIRSVAGVPAPAGDAGPRARRAARTGLPA